MSKLTSETPFTAPIKLRGHSAPIIHHSDRVSSSAIEILYLSMTIHVWVHREYWADASEGLPATYAYLIDTQATYLIHGNKS